MGIGIIRHTQASVSLPCKMMLSARESETFILLEMDQLSPHMHAGVITL